MTKSLTEAAKAVLSGQNLEEMTSNAATLKPKSKSADAPQTLGSATKVAEAPVKSGEGSNVGQAASAPVKKDNSAPTRNAKPAEPAKALREDEELEDENLVSEEEQIDEVLDTAGKKLKYMAKATLSSMTGDKKTKEKRSRGAKSIAKKVEKQKDDNETKAFSNKKAGETLRSMGQKTGYGSLYDKIYKEEVELSEEIEEFIDQMIEEGASEEEIMAVLEENFELVSEEYDIEISEELQEFIDELIAEGATEDEIAIAIEENFELVEEKDEDEEDEDEDEDEGKSMKEEIEIDMSEDLDALFSGEELSEDFKEKAKTIFESAVRRKVEIHTAIMEEAAAKAIEEEVDSIKEELSENVNDYLNYVVENWVVENEVAIEAGLRTELTEEFITGLKNLFEEHYIDIPEEKVDVIEEMGEKIEELEMKLNEEIENNINLSKMINESRTHEILSKACEGLTDTQSEKLLSLVEGVDYSDIEEYSKKVQTIKESYFSKTENVKSAPLDEVESVSDGKSMISEELNGPMAAYVKSLGKVQKK